MRGGERRGNWKKTCYMKKTIIQLAVKIAKIKQVYFIVQLLGKNIIYLTMLQLRKLRVLYHEITIQIFVLYKLLYKSNYSKNNNSASDT